MEEHKLSSPMMIPSKPVGDSAVDGLLAGLVAGLAMAVLLAGVTLLRGETPAVLFSRFAFDEQTSALAGFFSHLAVSAIYGLLFALLQRLLLNHWRRGLAAMVAGLVYGLTLLALALTVILPGAASPLLQAPPAILAAGHALYGLVLGWVLQRM